jgi:uncharacterized protein YbjT (DUF2867 family)
MDQNQKTILVVSATGTQGRAATKLLLQKGFSVRILVRNPDSPSAQELIKAGAQAYKGDLADLSSLEAAVKGVYGVYSILPIDLDDGNIERDGGKALIDAARKAGVQQFIHASVANAGTHESFDGWGTGYWNEIYWIVKWQVEEAVRNAGFPFWTILKPVIFMENFLPPLRDYFYPKMKEGKLLTPQKGGDKKWQWVTVEDTAKYASAAFADPEKFNKQSLDIASDSLTLAEASAVLTKVLGKKFEFITTSPEELIENGVFPFMARAMELYNAGLVYHADFEKLKPYKIEATTLEQWLTNHRDLFNELLNA